MENFKNFESILYYSKKKKKNLKNSEASSLTKILCVYILF